MSEYTQVQRQLQILTILNENPDGLDIATLHSLLKALGYGVTDRTIRRDINSLSRSFSIYEDNNTKPIRFILQKTNLKNINMSFDELQAIRLIQELISPYKHLDVGTNAERLLQTLLDSLPTNQKNWLLQASPLLQVNLNDLVNEQDCSPEIKRIIQEAITQHLCIKVRYYSFHSNTIRFRTIEPHLLEINQGCYHLWAYCHERREMRDFRVSRILSANITSEIFTPNNNLVEKCLKNRFKNMSSQEAKKVVMKFSGNSARIIREYHANKADKLEILGDGTAIFERTVAVTPDLIQWILGFGAEVEVLEPEYLRETIRKIAIRMLCAYEELAK
ncbi:MAG: WYL domain-containing protein [Clostridiaceae bacterium]|jgi:proteasome accessory factor B|nr:WYL domain-containing protein [Clostridiaceae bacterium]